MLSLSNNPMRVNPAHYAALQKAVNKAETWDDGDILDGVAFKEALESPTIPMFYRAAKKNLLPVIALAAGVLFILKKKKII